MPKHATEFEAGRIVGMIEAGTTQRVVAKKIGFAQSTVSLIWKKFKRTGKYYRQKGSGRKKSWNSRNSRYIKKLLLSGKCQTATEIQDFLGETGKLTYKTQTIRRMLHSTGFHGRAKIRTPFISKKNQLLRYKFAMNHKHWTVDDWKKVIFTDETRIKRFGSDGKQYIWRKKGESLSFRMCRPSFKMSSEDFMVWSCFGYKGVGWMAKIEGNMNSKLYMQVLEEDFQSSIEHCLMEEDQSEPILLQDNAACHKSGDAMGFISEKSWKTLDFPPQSPDLNPIEQFVANI